MEDKAWDWDFKVLHLRFMFWTIYILNRFFDVPKNCGSWKLEHDLREKFDSTNHGGTL